MKVYALHLDGEIINTNIWEKYSSKYGVYGWKPPKRLYFKPGHAKTGRSHLPHQIRDKVEIAVYEFSHILKEDK